MIYKLNKTHVVAEQWNPEESDAIIAELRAGGVRASYMEINGFNLIFSVDGLTRSVMPGQWIVLTLGHAFVIEDRHIGEYLDLDSSIG